MTAWLWSDYRSNVLLLGPWPPAQWEAIPCPETEATLATLIAIYRTDTAIFKLFLRHTCDAPAAVVLICSALAWQTRQI